LTATLIDQSWLQALFEQSKQSCCKEGFSKKMGAQHCEPIVLIVQMYWLMWTNRLMLFVYTLPGEKCMLHSRLCFYITE
jgi:hypothetical protein